MKSIKEYIILAVIILALIGYLVLHKGNQIQYQLPKLPKLADKNITRITLAKADKTIDLKKKDDQWVILPEGYPASKSKMKSIVDAVGSLSVSAMVSEGGDGYPYELDPKHRIVVTAFDGDKKIRSFDVGKVAPTYRHTFVQLPNDKHIYHAENNLRSTFDQTTAALRAKDVFAFDTSDISGIEITRGKDTRHLKLTQPPVNVDASKTEAKTGKTAPQKQQKPEWTAANGKSVDQATVTKLLGQLSQLKCKSYIDGKKKTDYTDPIYTIKLVGEKDHILSIFDKTDKKAETYPAVTSDCAYPFSLSGYEAENIMKKLLPPQTPPAPAQKARGLKMQHRQQRRMPK